jgi:hypothetical protein
VAGSGRFHVRFLRLEAIRHRRDLYSGPYHDRRRDEG